MIPHVDSTDNFKANGSNITLITSSFNELSEDYVRFNLDYSEDQESFTKFLFQEALPELIIKIIGTSHGTPRSSMQASVQNSFNQTMNTILRTTNIWLLNATDTMLDFDESDDHLIGYAFKDQHAVFCKSYGKSKLFIYQSKAYGFINEILYQLKRQESFFKVPVIALLLRGDVSGVADFIDHINNRVPVIVLKGTGTIVSRIANIYEKSTSDFNHIDQGFTETTLYRLTHLTNNEKQFILICQPGRDQLEDIILRAISLTLINIRYRTSINAIELGFAIQWNRIYYTRSNILNHNRILNWTNKELDECLEMAIVSNAVPFVELLFEYGASLKRLSLIGNSDLFVLENEFISKKSDAHYHSIGVLANTKIDPNIKLRLYYTKIFCWAVENQYFDLVMSICTRVEDPIISMLLVSQWCKYKEQMNSSTSELFRTHRRRFDIYVAHLLDLYYEDHPEKLSTILENKSVMFPDQLASVLVDEVCSKDLVSTKCIQSYMDEIWYGNEFHRNRNFTWEILLILCCICPFLLFIPIIYNRIFQKSTENQKGRSCCGTKTIFGAFCRFYQGNIAVHFHYSVASYAAFIILYSYVILFDYFPLNIYKEKRSNIVGLPIPITEIVLHVFILSMAIAELRQVILHVQSSKLRIPFWKKLAARNRHKHMIWSYYTSDPWNILDFFAFILWLIGFVTRFFVQEPVFVASKIFMSLDLCLWYMRCLHVFLASKRLGPTLLTIFNTMKDLTLFLLFIFIFLCAYSVTTYSLISTSSFVNWTNSTHFITIQHGGNITNFEILRNIIEWGTWKIFGSTSLVTSDAVETKYTVGNDGYGFITLLLTITYLIIAYVLLLNNLIALFNFTIQRIHEESQRAWCYHFYVVLRDYDERDVFVPPFNLLLFPLDCYLTRKFAKKKNESSFDIDERDCAKLRKTQQKIAEKYWKDKQVNGKEFVKQQSYICASCKNEEKSEDNTDSTYF